MVTAKACAQICSDLYDNPDPATGNWLDVWNGGGVFCAVRKLDDGELVLVFRGSTTVEDWERDFQPLPVWDKEVGYCHGGFLAQMDEALAEAIPAMSKDPHTTLTVTGHSLGAARARIAAAKLTVRGLKVDHLCTFGSPRPGFATVRNAITKSGMIHESFRYNDDPVCLVPFPIPLVMPFEHTEPWTQITGPNNPDDPWGPLRDHHIQLYVAGVP